MPGRYPRFNYTEVDGVPCIWMDDRSETVLAALLFRVGCADETLASSGISHLVEHPVLPTASVPNVEYNGTVDMLTTHFWAVGDSRGVVDEIEKVTELLSSPPVGRIPAERSILRAEAETRSSGDFWRLSTSLRYGPVAHGLRGYREVAPFAATDDDIVRWARTRFTRANAVLYVTRRPPKRLRLRLRGGRRCRLSAGYAAAAAGSWRRAARQFTAALEDNTQHCCAQTWSGLAALELGDEEAAVRAYEGAEASSMCECASRLRLRAGIERTTG
jgi:hypothetical protein